MKYKKLVEYLESFKPTQKWKWNKDIGLDKFSDFLRLLDNPHKGLNFVHLAGTSGKGSTATILASILKEAGYKTGLTVSPDVFSIRERLQINNKKISREKFRQIFEKIEPSIEQIRSKYGKPPSFYEVLLAMFFVYCQNEKCEAVVLETGLGGRLDATNVVDSRFQIITNVGLDHTRVLGKTKKLILKDKQEIIKNNSVVVSGIKQEYLRKIIKEKVRNMGSKIVFLSKDFDYKIKDKKTFSFYKNGQKIDDLKINLLGKFQFDNVAVAIAMALEMKNKFKKISLGAIRKGIERARIPGRFEIVSSSNPLIVFDGAHNPDKMRALVKSIKYYYPEKKFVTLFRYKKRKDILKILKPLVLISQIIVVTGSKGVGDTGFDEVFTKEDIRRLPKEFKIRAEVDLEKAYLLAKEYSQKYNTGILATGSFYMMKELKELL